MSESKLKAILFDSGRVLNIPKSGHWFISPNFFKYVDENIFKTVSTERKQIAFRMASEYMDSQYLIRTKEEEYAHFIRFYDIFSRELPELGLKEDDRRGLAKDIVYNSDKYVFFDDAIKAISELSHNYKLAVVSDAWPSLEDVLPSNALFVDDNINNCKGAMQLGIHAVWLCRNKLQYICNKVLSIGEDYEVINSLDQLNRTKMLRKKSS